KSLGAERILSISAVGSLREDYAPGSIVVPDQLIDFTKDRQRTFFGEGLVAHVGTADTFCGEFSRQLFVALGKTNAIIHKGGPLVTIEGPRFSTKAESQVFRSWGASLIGMTACPEAFLAREAELCYATVALVTDYDCWHETEEAVTVDAILAALSQNVALAKRMLRQVVPSTAGAVDCVCHRALQDAIVTAPDRMPASLRRKLALLMERVISAKKGAR
ncbi:MAG: MTAP family purine nucleoside phosphorylase, partial [Nitrospirae bacterium]|nr:MTAP family purine nucleoside phosphorylase [Nitrospirota bacterium]